MSRYVRNYVEACDTCPRIKDPRHKPYGLLQPLDIPQRPWQSISMDFIVKLPMSRGYDSIWVVCDRLTRAAHFIPCNETITAQELAWLFLARIFRLHGLPSHIISDRGSVFVSHFWKALTALLNVELKTSTAYHPQTDGLTERTNQTLETYLRAYTSYQQDDWVDYLPLAEFTFNNLENSSTQQTPFFANIGFHPTFEAKVSERSTVPAAEDLAERLRIIHEELRAELEFAQARQTHFYNQRHSAAPILEPGQLVWLHRRNIKTTRPSYKLDHRRLGPFRVIQRVKDSDSYVLKLPSYLSRLYPVFHSSLLEPYSDPSEFHPHASPIAFELSPESQTPIKSILESRKVGQRYEYLVNWKDQPESENSWIPLSDIPSSHNELIDKYHRRHPRSPRPPAILLSKSRPFHSTDTHSSSDSTSNLNFNSTPSRSIPPQASHRPRSPPPITQNLRAHYEPAPQSTTRSGRISKPPVRLDP